MADKATTDAAYVLKDGDTMTGGLVVFGQVITDGEGGAISTAKLVANRVEAGAVEAMSLELEGRLTARTELFVGYIDDTGETDNIPGTLRVLGESVISGPVEIQNQVDTARPALAVLPALTGVRTAVDISTGGAATSLLFSGFAGAVGNASDIGYVINSPTLLKSYHRGRLGLNVTNPAAQLEVVGETILRGELSVTGDITSTGTAHSFAAGSIPASAISGLPSGGGSTFTTPITVGDGRSAFTAAAEPFAISLKYNAAGLPLYIGATAGNRFQVSSPGGAAWMTVDGQYVECAGQVNAPAFRMTAPVTPTQGTTSTNDIGSIRYDSNYLYIATGIGTWKRIPLETF
jgi:hypothetical protein